MSTIIIGTGLAGLITAVRIKINSPDEEVVLLDKAYPEGNTYIAGQRIRAGIAGKRDNPTEEVIQLLSSRNNGIISEPMRLFSRTLIDEINYWQNEGVPHIDNAAWFGPQWGDPNMRGVVKANSVLQWFKIRSKSLNVQFHTGIVLKIVRKGSLIDKLVVLNIHKKIVDYKADRYVLAGGSATGLLYTSTNRLIPYPPQLLAYDAGIPLSGSTLSMVHPFGFCDKSQQPIPGCFETDQLKSIRLFSAKNKRFEHIESLLQKHQAHYHFPAICSEIWKHGGFVNMKSADNIEKKACVSIHGNQLGISTSDGVRIKGVPNGFAVGDACSPNYWTNHTVRFPGFGLGNCLVTGKLCAEIIRLNRKSSKPIRVLPNEDCSQTTEIKPNSVISKTMRTINTKHTLNFLFGLGEKSQTVSQWTNDLNSLDDAFDSSNYERTILKMSVDIAQAHGKLGLNQSEPITIFQQNYGQIN